MEFDIDGFLTINAPVTMSGGIHKTGSSQLILTATNSYSGLTYIDDGIIFLGNGTPDGTFGTGPVVLDSNTRIAMNRTTTASILNPITGDGLIQLYGNGEVEFGFVNMVHPGSVIQVGFALNSPRLLVTTNSDITISSMYCANVFGSYGNILQTGGSLAVTNFSGLPEFRLAYLGGTNTTYDMQGGTLYVPHGGIAVGFSGTGIWNMMGGTACVERVAVNYFAGVGNGTLNLGGGVLQVSAGGITNQGVPYAVNFTVARCGRGPRMFWWP